MLLWQFIVLTVLIGGLLVCGSILTRRLGCMNARLKRIEEALLVKDRPIEHADATQAQAEREVVPGKEGRVDYLTIRDLKVSSERLSARATPPSSRSSVVVPESRDALEAISERPSSPTMQPASGDSLATSSESRDALETTSGPQSPPPQSPPGSHPPSEDSVAKKNLEALLILNSQRRRRRARLGH